MKFSHRRKGFTLVELLATIAIMAVLIVAALPYVADYTRWARATSELRDAQVVQGAISRWVAVGADVTHLGGTYSTNNMPSDSDWRGAKFNYAKAWTSASKPSKIIMDLVHGWTVVPNSGNRDPFLAPNTAYTALGLRIKIGFTDSRHWTVAGRSEM